MLAVVCRCHGEGRAGCARVPRLTLRLERVCVYVCERALLYMREL